MDAWNTHLDAHPYNHGVNTRLSTLRSSENTVRLSAHDRVSLCLVTICFSGVFSLIPSTNQSFCGNSGTDGVCGRTHFSAR